MPKREIQEQSRMVAEAESREGQKMKTVEFEKVKVGDLVEVPRTQFAPMRRGWNGWLFSEAVVIQKGISPKNKRKVIKVEMRTPKSRNDYGTMEKTFYAECVFQTKSIETARRFMQQDGVNSKEEFYEYIKQDDVCGCDWIKFLVDKGFLFQS